MSLIFESDIIKKDPQTTATHVLLIGCGAYPHLANAGYGGLKPLTSPKLSAEAMAEWFLSGPDSLPKEHASPPNQAFHNPNALLGTLTMLSSPSVEYVSPSGSKHNILTPTKANIYNAYNEWLDRLGTNPKSVGVFYFCGHGVSNGINQFLVADDFGSQQRDLWAGVFHIANTCRATTRQTAANLFFFIDACMEINEDLVNQIDGPRSLIGGERTGKPLTTEWALLGAASTSRRAYAPENNVAHFTSALLKALRGHCGDERDDGTGFDVCASNLRAATVDFINLSQQPNIDESQKFGWTEGEGTWKAAMHVLKERPSVFVQVDINRDGYRSIASAFIEDRAKSREIKLLKNGPVDFIRSQGEWTLGTSAESGEYDEQLLVNKLLIRAAFKHQFIIP